MRAAGPPCGTPGCLRATREGKPACPDHAIELPYPRAVAARWEALQANEDAEIADEEQAEAALLALARALPGAP